MTLCIDNNVVQNDSFHVALFHDLTPESEAAALAARITDLEHDLQPADPLERSLVVLTARSSFQADRCYHLENAERSRLAERAALCWDDDRVREAEDLGATLHRNPSRVVSHLKATTQGCRWLIDRWQRLADVVRAEGEIKDARRSLALDLLGTPRDLRAGAPFDEGGLDALIALAESQIAELKTLQRDVLDELDARDRERAMRGQGLGISDESRRLLRRESAASRAFYWAIDRLRSYRKERATTPPVPVSALPRSSEPRVAVSEPKPPQTPAAEPPLVVDDFESLLAEKPAQSFALSLGHPVTTTLSMSIVKPPDRPNGNRRARRARLQRARRAT